MADVVPHPEFTQKLKEYPRFVREYYENILCPLLRERPKDLDVGRHIAGTGSTYKTGECAIGTEIDEEYDDGSQARYPYTFFYEVVKRDYATFVVMLDFTKGNSGTRGFVQERIPLE